MNRNNIVKIFKKIIKESEVGFNYLKSAYDKISVKYPDLIIKYDEGHGQFEPYIHISIKNSIDGLLIEWDKKSNSFILFYDNGYEDEPWNGWRSVTDNLYSINNLIKAIDLFLNEGLFYENYK